MRFLITSLVLLSVGCDSSIVSDGNCIGDACECEGESCESEPVCPLDCRRPEDPEACGDPCEEPPSDCELPTDLETFETGTGELCYERLAEDHLVPHVEGPQGGYHMFLAIACSDCDGDVMVETRARREDTDEEVSSLSQSVVAVQGGIAAGIIVPLPGSPWDPDSPALEQGTHLLLNTTLKSLGGDVLHSAEDLRVVGPSVVWDYCATHPEDPCCIEMCDGI